MRRRLSIWDEDGAGPTGSSFLADPPPETGRNPQAVAVDLISGVFLVPGAIVAVVATVLLGAVLQTAMAPPPGVPLDEALQALEAIEDSYNTSGPSIGLRQKVTNWFQWAQPNRRLEVEVSGLTGKAKERAKELSKDAAETIASIVEYSGNTGGVTDGRETGWTADRLAAQEAEQGYGEAEAFSGEALKAGRKKLAEAVAAINEAQQEVREAQFNAALEADDDEE